jgi:HPt (histidine-containing phosphotransfer) domain-containing protein
VVPLVLDAGALARLTELDPKGENRLLERVLQAFQTSVARLRPQLDTARRERDRRTIRLVAHTLKSSSASIGAIQLSQLCARIEGAIRLRTDAALEPDAGAKSESDSGANVDPKVDANVDANLDAKLEANLEAMGAALDGTLAAIALLLKDRK